MWRRNNDLTRSSARCGRRTADLSRVERCRSLGESRIGRPRDCDRQAPQYEFTDDGAADEGRVDEVPSAAMLMDCNDLPAGKLDRVT